MKKLINYKYDYSGDETRIEYLSFIFDDETIRYSFISDRLFSFSKQLAFGFENSLKHFEYNTDAETFNIIESAFARKLTEYL